MNHVNLPKNPELAGKIVEAEAANEKVRLERGALGWLFGSKDNVPHYVAGIVACLGMLLLIGIMLVAEDSGAFPRKEAAAFTLSVVTLALGFLFGRSSKS